MNRGYTLIEVLVVGILILSTTFFVNKNFYSDYEKRNIQKNIVNIKKSFRKYQLISESYKKEIIIKFDFNNKIIYFEDNILKLDNNYEYRSNNKYNKYIFERKFNKNGRLNKSFTILIIKKNKIIEKLTFNTNNSLGYFIINEKK